MMRLACLAALAATPLAYGANAAAGAQSLSDPLMAYPADVPDPRLPCEPDAVVQQFPLTVRDAIRFALCGNPRSRGAWAEVRRSAADLGTARSEQLPTLDLQASHVDSDESIVNDASASVLLGWTVLDFGGRSARAEAASSRLAAARADLLDTLNSVAMDAVERFYAVASAEAAVAAAHEDLLARDANVAAARSRRAVGAGTLADELQAETARAEAVVEVHRQEGRVLTARADLSVLLGLPPNISWLVRTDRSALPPLEVNSPEEAVRLAMDSHPDMQSAAASVRASEADASATRARYRPKVTLQAEISQRDGLSVSNQAESAVGLYVTQPLFSGFASGYERRSAEALTDRARADHDARSLAIQANAWNRFQEVGTVRSALAAARALESSATESVRVAEGSYLGGAGTLTDLLYAQSALAAAHQSRIEAEFGLFVAEARLRAAVGAIALPDGRPLPMLRVKSP